MTNHTPHGQVPEALIDLIDAYAEARHRCGGIYNAKTEAARKAVIEALSGVQALSAAPGVTSEQRRLIGVIADKIEDGTLFQSGIYPKKDLARFVRNMLDTTPTAPAASPTPPAEQQAAPKAAPAVLHDIDAGVEVMAWLRESGAPHSIYSKMSACLFGDPDKKATALKAAPQQGAQEPVASEEERRKLKGLMLEVWACAKPQPDVTNAQLRALLSRCLPHIRTLALAEAPKPAPAPLSEDAKDAARYRWLRDFHHGDVQDELPYIAAGEGYDGAWALTGEDADKEIDAAIAAQGGK